MTPTTSFRVAARGGGLACFIVGGVRVLLSGMGGELGARVASLLEDEPWVASLEGIDVDPPRRRLRRTVFHRVIPGQPARTTQIVTSFNPHVVVHIAVWEPHARAAPTAASELTAEAATTILGAAAECPALESIVVRSGIEIYGRSRGAATRPAESSPLRPTSDYGRMLEQVERVAATAGEQSGATIGCLRLATVLGPHVPSTLGRVLRLPTVPFSPMADSPFTVIHQQDAAEAFVAAARDRVAEPLNIVSPGEVTMYQALRRGRRIPMPIIGPPWVVARALCHLGGAPIPEHIFELIGRGRLADGTRAAELLDFRPMSTGDVIDELYGWPSVIHTPAKRQIA
jgi:UDP-glucose 4-epimerase